MKAVTITMPEELDAQATAEARRLGISKSELIRRGLAAVLPAVEPDSGNDLSGNDLSGNDLSGNDLWHELAGFGSPDVSIEPGEIDDIVYSH